ncbi:hypothetical protein E2C01_095658 [Portunus trituberculatus]|uniref:Uncharacterized protein n=1 Tax=Portunus trituberculatus TaxID=210409 RepID=A0A5B7JZE5_PORTR|nr:hypothetical protein [Portunus trituberculatus]
MCELCLCERCYASIDILTDHEASFSLPARRQESSSSPAGPYLRPSALFYLNPAGAFSIPKNVRRRNSFVKQGEDATTVGRGVGDAGRERHPWNGERGAAWLAGSIPGVGGWSARHSGARPLPARRQAHPSLPARR